MTQRTQRPVPAKIEKANKRDSEDPREEGGEGARVDKNWTVIL